MRLDWQLSAACGYAELGMVRESIAELNAIPAEFQDRPEVLQLRLHHLMQRKAWHRALLVSRKLCRVAPDAGAGYLHSAFCLNQLGRTKAARDTLSKAPPALRREPIYHYNMACYEALLGRPRAARRHLQVSFRMDETFREVASKDPDLRSLKGMV